LTGDRDGPAAWLQIHGRRVAEDLLVHRKRQPQIFDVAFVVLDEDQVLVPDPPDTRASRVVRCAFAPRPGERERERERKQARALQLGV
jgi:hypothetical protein